MHQDSDSVGVGSSLPRLGTTCANFDLTTCTKFVRSTSSSGFSHDQESGCEMVENGCKQDTLSKLSRKASSYVCHSRDVGDQIVASINLSRDVSQRILEAVDSSLLTQVGDNRDRVAVERNEEDNLCRMYNARDLESPALVFLNDTLTLSNGSKSCTAVSASPLSPLADGTLSPISTNAVVHISKKNQKQVTQSLSHKKKASTEYGLYFIHDSLGCFRNRRVRCSGRGA